MYLLHILYTFRSKLEDKRKGDTWSLESNMIDVSVHQKEELDAAVALTNLAGNFRNRLLNLAKQ